MKNTVKIINVNIHEKRREGIESFSMKNTGTALEEIAHEIELLKLMDHSHE